MKRAFLMFIMLSAILIICPTAISSDFLPRYSDSINHYGVGVYLAPKEITIYSSNENDSRVIEHIKWSKFGVSSLNEDLSSKNVFISFVPTKDIALMSVVDDTDDWIEVIYDQKTGAKGWIKRSNSGKFLTWLEFMNKYGLSKEVYLFLDLPQEYRIIRTAPDEKAQVLAVPYYSPDNVKLKYVKGNWMLVKVIDYSKTNTYIGWIKWRDDDGKIYAFPNLKL